jgi:hypothetical protein
MKENPHILAVDDDFRNCDFPVCFLAGLKIGASCAGVSGAAQWIARNETFDAALGQRDAQFATGRAAHPPIERSQDTRCVDGRLCSYSRSFI